MIADAGDEEDVVLQPADLATKNGDKESSAKPPIVKNVEDEDQMERRRRRQKSMEEGIRVVSAFEGYAYDAGLRVGDKLLAIDDFQIKPTTKVDEVRNHLRGEPGTPVQITFLREGVGGETKEPQTISMERAVVHIPDVKYYGFIGDPKDGIGYIDLSGFANDAGRYVLGIKEDASYESCLIVLSSHRWLLFTLFLS
jgi:C-terminal processing protease CtpA/Prc